MNLLPTTTMFRRPLSDRGNGVTKGTPLGTTDDLNWGPKLTADQDRGLPEAMKVTGTTELMTTGLENLVRRLYQVLSQVNKSPCRCKRPRLGALVGAATRPAGARGRAGSSMDAHRPAAYSATPLGCADRTPGFIPRSSEPTEYALRPFLATALLARATLPVQRGVSIGRAGRGNWAGRSSPGPFQGTQGSLA